MATKMFHFKEEWEEEKSGKHVRQIFASSNMRVLEILSFKDGIAEVRPLGICKVDQFAQLVADCFDKNSNFKSGLFKAFACNENARFEGIRFVFNGETLLFTEKDAFKDQIFSKCKTVMHTKAEKERLEREAYMKTPEYRIKRAKELKIRTRRERVIKEAMEIDKVTALEFKSDEAKEAWEKWIKANSSSAYGLLILHYTRRWAKYMQHLMKKHKKELPKIAKNSSSICDREGMTGNSYGIAVAVLSLYWKYGDELRNWHNKRWGYEGTDGVVNPAVLNISI